jgi:hypothetical protein
MSSDMRLLGSIHRSQAKIYRMLQWALQRQIRTEYEADPQWEMPEDVRAKLMEINKFLSETTMGMVRVNDAAAKATAALTLEQLEAQMRAELLRAAWSFTVEEWQLLDEVRAKKAASRAQKEEA